MAEVAYGTEVGAPVVYGVSPGPPGFGPGMPIGFPPDGLAGCAQTGAANASAAIAATPVHTYLMLILLTIEAPMSLYASCLLFGMKE